MNNSKFYLKTWFICLCFLFSALIVPFIFGVIFLILQYVNNKEQIKAYQIAITKNIDISNINEYVQKKNNEADKLINDANEKAEGLINSVNKKIETLEHEKNTLEKEINQLREDILIETIDISNYENINSEECKSKLELLKLQYDKLVKNNNAVEVEFYSDKKILENNKKQLLRCFNSECAIIFNNISLKNASVTKTKVTKTFEVLNKIFSTDNISLSEDLLEIKLKEFDLIYAYLLKREQEKEQEKAIREQLIEEEKVRREIEKEKQIIEKEEQQFKSEITKLMGYMNKVTDEIQSQLYVDKIRELEEKLKLLEKDKDNVLQREQNTRAGYVYIISNIGSFGEDVYKIGMTRRLEPMDRIKELGDASVPFEFDVHALIFSEDAPALETLLHQTFKENQVNLVNSRKEFFNINLENIKEVVINKHNATVNFVTIPKAEDYRESLRLRDELSA